jgi:hypothetical protein
MFYIAGTVRANEWTAALVTPQTLKAGLLAIEAIDEFIVNIRTWYSSHPPASS